MREKKEAKDSKTPDSISQTSTEITTPYYYDIDDDEERLLVEQIKYLHSERCSIQSSFVPIISISIAVYGIILYHAFALDNTLDGKVNYVFIVLPFLFFLSFYNIIKYTAKILGINSYIKHLESTLNHHRGKALFQWHSYLIQANGAGFFGGIAQIPCYLALTLFLGFKYRENITKNDCLLAGKCVFTALLAVEVLVLLAMLLFCITEANSIEYWCNKITAEYNSEDNTVFRTRRPHWKKAKK